MGLCTAAQSRTRAHPHPPPRSLVRALGVGDRGGGGWATPRCPPAHRAPRTTHLHRPGWYDPAVGGRQVQVRGRLRQVVQVDQALEPQACRCSAHPRCSCCDGLCAHWCRQRQRPRGCGEPPPPGGRPQRPRRRSANRPWSVGGHRRRPGRYVPTLLGESDVRLGPRHTHRTRGGDRRGWEPADDVLCC